MYLQLAVLAAIGVSKTELSQGHVRSKLRTGKRRASVHRINLATIMPPKPFAKAKQIIDNLWSTPALDLPATATQRLILTGPPEPVVPSSF